MIYNDIIDYLEALSSILRHEQKGLATRYQLQPVHLQIINYLGRCNRYSDSLQVLCDFLGQTKGTVSTSVALLEGKDLLRKHLDAADKRKIHLQLTASGKDLYMRQFEVWRAGLVNLNEDQQQDIKGSLHTLLSRLQDANQHKLFGACHSCKHLKREGKLYLCGLTKETLIDDDLEKICVYHEVP